MENKTLAVRETAQKNPIKRFFSMLNAKRKKITLSISTTIAMSMATAVNAFAASSGEGALDAGEAEFNTLIGWFALWIGRIGLVVAFVGGIMFGLAFKNEDAEAKSRGLMTLASGFIVFALSKSLNLFGIEVPAF